MELSWWNLIPTYFDGIAFTIPFVGFPVHWYGVMYIFAFVTAYLTMWKISEKEKLGYTKEQLDNIFTWIIAGILLGARLGYVFFYKPGYRLRTMNSAATLSGFRECRTMAVSSWVSYFSASAQSVTSSTSGKR